MKHKALFLTLFATTALHLSAHAAPTVKVDGSSTVFPVTEAVAEEFQTNSKGKMRVTVGISGTGGGFKKFCRGETDVQNASRPILVDEMANCKKAGISYYELPIAFDAITIAVSPKNTWVKDITVDELKKIWEPSAQGKIMKWNQVRASWPDSPIKLYGAGADSGTFDYFTESVVGKSKASRGDYTASEDDNTIVMGISNDPNALGYLPFAYYEPNKEKLKVVAVDGGPKAPKKGAILPSSKTVEDGTYFPLSRPIFIYVSEKSVARPEVKQFIEFYLEKGGDLATQVKYVSLPKKAYTMALDKFKNGKVGTAFGGHPEVGIEIEELLKRDAKN
jgi:phosphate transport system substrate-binding protein